MKIPVVWYGNNEGMYRGWWDMGILEEIFKGSDHYLGIDKLPDGIGAVVILPGRALAGKEKEINKDLKRLSWCLLVVAGDEENSFSVEDIKHPNIKIWIQNPRTGRHDNFRRMGCGYPPELSNFGPKEDSGQKVMDWFFAGQINHERREEMAKYLENVPKGIFKKTPSFATGFTQDGYYRRMVSAKIVPCPSGPETPDTFRLYEALELGCVPIADTQTPKEDWTREFWPWLFGEGVPFPTIVDWEYLPGTIEDCVSQFPTLNNRIQAWWMRYKRKVEKNIADDIKGLCGGLEEQEVTIIIPTSPVKSNPDTSIIEETINSVRYHFPNSEIILTFDGVRKEQKKMKADYEEFIRRVLWKARSWNVKPYIFDEHMHQSGMARSVIDEIETPMILYVESDTPLVTDEPIGWSFLKETILKGHSNLMRLHFEGVIPKDHEEMMIDEPLGGVLKTIQWSQRPHLASTAYYRRILGEHFSEKSRVYIEDKMHSVIIEAFKKDGMQGWQQHRLHIYYPDPKNIKRSYHLDQREGDSKFEDKFVW